MLFEDLMKILEEELGEVEEVGVKNINWTITKWCKSITDSGKDEYVNKEVDKKHMIYRFRLLDDDGIVYAYGVSDDDKSFSPLDYYAYSYGVTEIQYKNKETGEYETL